MISNTYANTILNTLVRRTGSENPSIYLGLCKTEPDAATGAVNGEPPISVMVGEEIVKTGYTRKNVISSFSSASGGVITNSGEIQMNTARQPWGEGEDKMMYWFLSHSASSNAVIWGKIKDADGNEGIEIPMNTVPTFYEGQLKASIDVPLD